MKLELIMPLPPNRANARWHWSTESKLKNFYFVRCNLTVTDMNGIRHRRLPHSFRKARLTATLFLHNPMDPDNLMARMKWPMDWLVRYAGVLIDDRPDVVTWTTPPAQEIDRKNPRIELEIEEVT